MKKLDFIKNNKIKTIFNSIVILLIIASCTNLTTTKNTKFNSEKIQSTINDYINMPMKTKIKEPTSSPTIFNKAKENIIKNLIIQALHNQLQDLNLENEDDTQAEAISKAFEALKNIEITHYYTKPELSAVIYFNSKKLSLYSYLGDYISASFEINNKKIKDLFDDTKKYLTESFCKLIESDNYEYDNYRYYLLKSAGLHLKKIIDNAEKEKEKEKEEGMENKKVGEKLKSNLIEYDHHYVTAYFKQKQQKLQELQKNTIGGYLTQIKKSYSRKWYSYWKDINAYADLNKKYDLFDQVKYHSDHGNKNLPAGIMYKFTEYEKKFKESIKSDFINHISYIRKSINAEFCTDDYGKLYLEHFNRNQIIKNFNDVCEKLDLKDNKIKEFKTKQDNNLKTEELNKESINKGYNLEDVHECDICCKTSCKDYYIANCNKNCKFKYCNECIKIADFTHGCNSCRSPFNTIKNIKTGVEKLIIFKSQENPENKIVDFWKCDQCTYYNKENNYACESCNNINNLKKISCSVCCEDLSNKDNKDKIIKLDGCTHIYHKNCIIKWYKSKKNTNDNKIQRHNQCPTCRTPYILENCCDLNNEKFYKPKKDIFKLIVNIFKNIKWHSLFNF